MLVIRKGDMTSTGFYAKCCGGWLFSPLFYIWNFWTYHFAV